MRTKNIKKLNINAGLSFAILAFFAPSAMFAESASRVSNSINTTGTIVKDKDFYELAAGVSGGAIYNDSTSSITTISGCTFKNNGGTTWDHNGGAIYNEGIIGTISGSYSFGASLEDSAADFYKNSTLTTSSFRSGGAIYNSGSISYIKNLSFAANSSYYGGAIYTSYYINEISDSLFQNNTATLRGGAIYNDGINSGISATIDLISNTTFLSNTSEYGGAIFNRTYDSTALIKEISGSTFSGNTAESGGAIFNYGTINLISGSSFSGNTATSGSGGAIYNDGTLSTISDSIFTGNTATSGGGAIYNDSDSTITISTTAGTDSENTNDILNSGNSAGNDSLGGFLYMGDSSSVNFATAKYSSITIGVENCVSGNDSIASANAYATITKTGLGTLTVNSSMQYYTGSLKVEEGLMEVNNALGAQTITIDTGATLSVSMLGDYMLSNESLSLTNNGTLTLVATASGDYTISANTSLDFSSAITINGTISGNTFTSSIVDQYSLGSTTFTVARNGNVDVLNSSSTKVLNMNLSTSGSITINSITDVSADLSEFVDDSNLLIVAYTFEVGGLSSGDSVVLSFVVADNDYSLDDFTLYYKADDDSWGKATSNNVSDVSYENGILSFTVDGFSSYGYSVIPEPSTYALIFGILSLGFVAYRRKRK